MGALLNPVPTKPPKTLKLNKYGRDPKMPAECSRRSSNYEKGTGYAPFFHGFMADWGRISSGHICDMMLMVVLGRSLGRGYVGKNREEETLPITYTETAQLVAPTEWPKVLRSVEREYARWQAVGIAEVRKTSPGTVVVKLLYRNWEALPDYHSNVVEISKGDEPEGESPEVEQKPGHQRLTPKPVTIPAGGKCKPIPVSCGVKSFQWRTEGPVDLTFTAVIQAGELLITSRVPDDWIEKLQKRLAVDNKTNDIACGNGRPRPNFTNRTSEQKAKHPRADELIAFLDPLLLQTIKKTISDDSTLLQLACEAIGSTPHEFMVEHVSERLERGLSSRRVIVDVLRECQSTWLKLKDLPVKKKPRREYIPRPEAAKY